MDIVVGTVEAAGNAILPSGDSLHSKSFHSDISDLRSTRFQTCLQIESLVPVRASVAAPNFLNGKVKSLKQHRRTFASSD